MSRDSRPYKHFVKCRVTDDCVIRGYKAYVKS